MILVVGATGMVGSEVCRLLAAKGEPVRAIVRPTADRSKVEGLRTCGATVVEGDLRDVRSLEAACKGVSAVITTASSMPFAYQPGANTPEATDQQGALSLVRAAAEKGARRFVYTSFPPMAVAFPLQDAKRAVEEELRRTSPLEHTILQPTFFMEAWLSPMVGFDAANRKASLYGSGENPISWISYRDVARFAVASVDNPAARNATLPLGGPEAVSPCGVVRIFEELGGARFEVTNVPAEALQQRLAAASDPMEKSFAGLMVSYAMAEPIEMKSILEAFPLELLTVREYARGAVSAR